jgi:hypothetical protein
MVLASNDLKVEPPLTIASSLPNIFALVIFFGAKRRMLLKRAVKASFMAALL